MTELERSDFVLRWSNENNGVRPRQGGGKEGDAVQKVMATWLSGRLKRGDKGHQRCMGPDYAPLRSLSWWRETIDALLQEKEACPIDGWDDMTIFERSDFVLRWSNENGGVRPRQGGGKEGDAVQKVMATWLSGRLKRGKGHQRCMGPDYAPLRSLSWWREAVGALLEEKEACPIRGWDDMTELERSDFVLRWSNENGGVRPRRGGGKEGDPAQTVMATWVKNRLKRGDKSMGPDYAPLQSLNWWRGAVGTMSNVQ
jgi:hypothetical protein